MALLAKDMYYTQKIPVTPKKLLDLINEFCKVNLQKSIAFLYAKNRVPERKIKKVIPFTTASKGIKYLRINLTKEVKDLFLENYETLIKETEDT